MADKPTVRKIARLLSDAGFPRSTVYRREVKWNEGSTGFRVWTTRSREAPDVELTAVAHYDKGQHQTDESWDAHKVSARRAVMRYADAIVAGGYMARLRFEHADPYVLVFSMEANRVRR